MQHWVSMGASHRVPLRVEEPWFVRAPLDGATW
jgi:hypothetical protein